MKRRIAALALALLAFPAHRARQCRTTGCVPIRALLAARSASRPTCSRTSRRMGTDVAAPDQQAAKNVAPSSSRTTGTDRPRRPTSRHPRNVAPATVSASSSATSDFDWADAAIGAAVTAGLLGLSFAGATALRRRQRRASALAG